MIFPQLLSRACASRRLLGLAAGFLFTAAAVHAEDIVWDFGTAIALSASPISQPANLTVSAVTQGNNNGTTVMLSCSASVCRTTALVIWSRTTITIGIQTPRRMPPARSDMLAQRLQAASA